MLGGKGKSNTISKANNTTRGNKPECTGEKRRRLKGYRDGIKQYRKKREIPKQLKKFYQQLGGECTNAY